MCKNIEGKGTFAVHKHEEVAKNTYLEATHPIGHAS